MAYRFTLPDLGEGIAEAEIVRWRVEPGEMVNEGDPLLEVETEKAIVEIPAPATGRVLALEVEEGERVPVGALLVVIDAATTAASPRARRLARELGVDIDRQGPDSGAGPLSEADVLARAGASSGVPPDGERVPLRGARARLARHLTRVQRDVPAVTVVDECDFTVLEEAHSGFRWTACVLKAVSAALEDVPELNATYVDGEMVVHRQHDIGLAVQAEGALVVPVIRDVDALQLDALADEVARVTAGAREGRLAPTELRGSTFTVTDPGPFGGLLATPLVNAPEVAVLGLHRVDDRPVARDGEIVIRRIGNVSCTFDHRVVDGFHASAFLLRLVELLQEPQAEPAEPGPDSDPDAGPDRLLELVCEQVAGMIGAGDGEVDPSTTFKDLGLDSLAAVELRNRLARATGLRLPTTLAFDCPTPEAVAERMLSGALRRQPRRAVRPAPGARTGEPVAILGMACRYPGGVDSPRGLWDLVAAERDAISVFPGDRGWDLERLYDRDPESLGTSYVREGGFLRAAAEFDAEFFGISPREALAMDPQQRLLLEVAWEALEDAGIDPSSLGGSPSGVFAGVIADGYAMGEGHSPDLEGLRLTGRATSVATGRLAYVLGLEGPAMTIDTACSSSLVALHLACQSLRSGECSLALAGGATVMTSPDLFVEFSRQRGLAPDGRCKAFAAAADGTAWAEGAGLVVLERLSDARRSGHPVLAVVRGSAVNQDGTSNGLTAPNGPAQERVISDALANAGVGAEEVDAVEAHGTGTELGDPIEAEALLSVYGRKRREGPLRLGSIKSNIGHSSAAAGVAGVIKMVMALRHERLPRTLHVDVPTPHVDWAAGGVELLTEAREWPRAERPRRAGISSFGISGTNAHLILEEAPDPPASAELSEEGKAPPLGGPIPLVLSAKSEPALREQASRLAARLEERPDLDPTHVAYSLATTRAAFEHRAVVLGEGRGELLASLKALARGGGAPAIARGTARTPRRPVFLFSGQGAQHREMALELLEASPAFAEYMAACEEALLPFVGWSLTDVLGDEKASWLDRLDVVQPALFAVMVSLARLWRRCGVEPAALVGHSQGEIAAAHVAGALSLEDAALIVAARGKAMAELAGRGGMLSVSLPVAELDSLLGSRAQRVSLAAVNGPRSLVLSGGNEALEEILAACEESGIRARRIAVDYAAHSSQIEPLEDELLEAFAPIRPRKAEIPLCSTVTGSPISGEELIPSYWYRNLRQPVLLEPALRRLLDEGSRVFIEIGPHPVLALGAEETFDAALADPREATLLPTLRRDEGGPGRFALSLAEAHARGVGVDWEGCLAGAHAQPRRVALPTYPFQRRRYWADASIGSGDVTAAGLDDPGHPLLGAAVGGVADDSLVLTGRVSLSTHPWLADHAVAGGVLLPGAAFLDLALTAAARLGAGQVSELTIRSPLVLSAQGSARLRVTVTGPDEGGRREIAIHSRPERDRGLDSPEWTLRAEGSLSDRLRSADDPSGVWPPPGAEPLDLEGAYDRLAELGYEYGPAFRGLRAAWRLGEEICAEVALPPGQVADAARFALHPALLDAALHAAMLDAASPGEPLVSFSFSGAGLGKVRGASELRVRLAFSGERISVRAFDRAGAVVCSIASLASRPLGPPRSETATDSLLVLGWSEVELVEEEQSGETRIFECRPAGTGSVAAEAREQSVALLEQLKAHVADEGPEGRLAIVTRGGVAAGPEEAPDPAAAALWGLARSAQAEHPGRFVLVDVDESEASRAAIPAALAGVEPQLALREGRALAPRLAPVGKRPGLLVPPPGSWQMDVRERGSLDSLSLLPIPRAKRPPGPAEVRLEVRAAGLNFRDVLIALDRYAGHPPLGGEGAGVVVEVGSEVSDLAPGDRVMGLVEGSFASPAVAQRALLAPIPAGWSFERAASTPIAFLTARYALLELGGLRRGERVLVHAGAGAVGMAAIQVARNLGAEVYTTAGPAKWGVLREAGLEEDRIASSRDLDFAEKFSGAGIDVVLNSLAGEFVDASLGLLRRGGRFLELGKADVRDPERVAARHGVSYRALDLLDDAGPERLGGMLTEVLALFERGVLRPLPTTGWSIASAPAAFRCLREGRNVGKLVLSLPRPIDPDSTLLIAGGTGALGALLARHLVERHGVRRLLLASRSGPAAEGAVALQAELEGLGAEVVVAACDVAEREQLATMLDRIPRAHPLGAVVHAAGELGDGTIETLDREGLDRVLRAKVDAAWHLHELTQGLVLSHFVMFSSVAGVLGGPGQANYAAANAFLDALALRRRREGLPGVSIAWGLWERESRMSAHLDGRDLARMRRLGIEPLADERGLALFDAALDADLPATSALGLDRAALQAEDRAGTLPPPLRGLVSAPWSRPPAPSLTVELADLDLPAREQAVLGLVRQEAATVLGHPSAAAVEPDRAFKDLGFDSLAAVELRNRLRMATGLELEATLVFDYPTPAELAGLLLRRTVSR